MKGYVVLLVALSLLLSCSSKEAKEELKSLLKGGPPIISINGQGIDIEDIEKEIRVMPESVRQAFFSDHVQFERFLEEYANKEILYLEAVKRGMEKEEEFLEKVEYFRKLTAIQLLLEKELKEKIKVSEKDLMEYYEKNREEFMTAESYHLSHILLKTEGEARGVLERLKKGEDFETIAGKLSEDKESAKIGGDLGYIEKGSLPQEINEAVQGLKKGGFSSPVKTEFGYHIIRLNDIKKGILIDFNTMKEEIRKVLMRERQQEGFEGYIGGLKGSYRVEINKEGIERYLKTKKTGSPH